MIKIRVNAIYCDEKERMIWGGKLKNYVLGILTLRCLLDISI